MGSLERGVSAKDVARAEQSVNTARDAALAFLEADDNADGRCVHF